MERMYTRKKNHGENVLRAGSKTFLTFKRHVHIAGRDASMNCGTHRVSVCGGVGMTGGKILYTIFLLPSCFIKTVDAYAYIYCVQANMRFARSLEYICTFFLKEIYTWAYTYVRGCSNSKYDFACVLLGKIKNPTITRCNWRMTQTTWIRIILLNTRYFYR